MNKNQKQKSHSLSYRELTELDSALEGLMLSPAIGVEKSLLLHKNRKIIKPLIEASSEKIEVIKKKCFILDEQNELALDNNNQPKFVEGMKGEYNKSMKEIMETEKHEIVFHTLLISELPESEKYGTLNGIDLYMNVPRLFDTVIIETSNDTI